MKKLFFSVSHLFAFVVLWNADVQLEPKAGVISVNSWISTANAKARSIYRKPIYRKPAYLKPTSLPKVVDETKPTIPSSKGNEFRKLKLPDDFKIRLAQMKLKKNSIG